LKWLKKNWDQFDRPSLFISTETPSLVDEFDDYAPFTSERLGVDLAKQPLNHYRYLVRDMKVREPWQMDFYPDFHLLSHCDVILGPSSTFSFAAAMLNETLAEYWRASLELVEFEKVDPWDAYPLLHEDVADFPHLEGIKLEGNPYW